VKDVTFGDTDVGEKIRLKWFLQR